MRSIRSHRRSVPRDRPVRARASALIPAAAFRRSLLAWYDRSRRDLPWRSSPDFYRVWVSEIMLQQTRVEAAIPYYQRFLDRFPTLEALAEASEADVLAAWSGLGYYRRARHLHSAARGIREAGSLPGSYGELLKLPGCGPYTAAAIASIALGLPCAAVDGNAARVIVRLTNDEGDPAAVAKKLLDARRPGDFNQAMMELGATVCTPGAPDCDSCPVGRFCLAAAAGMQVELPRPRKKPAARRVAVNLAVIEENGCVFLVRRGISERRMAGFWELPTRENVERDCNAQGKAGREGSGRSRARKIGRFRHQIVNDRMEVTVWRVKARTLPEGRWFPAADLAEAPLSTIAKKALAITRAETTLRMEH